MSRWKRIVQRGLSPGASAPSSISGSRFGGREKRRPRPPDCGQKESQEVLWQNNLSKPAWDPRRRPAGCEGGLTADFVNKLCDQGHVTEAVEALGVLVRTERCLSKSLFYTVLRRCVAQNDLVLGRRVHAFMVEQGYQSDTFLGTQLLRMYASHGRLQDAMDVLQMLPEPDAFTWSAIISAHAKHGQTKEAIQLYQHMRRSSVKPDGHVFVAALQACAKELDLKAGQQVHADVLASGEESDLFVRTCLVNMYAKCGSLKDAQTVFDGLGHKDVITWTALIAGYSQQGMGHEALGLYSAMQEKGVIVSHSVTFVCLLQACATVGPSALDKGKGIHAQIRDQGHEDDVFVANSLVNMYAKCGSLTDAQRVFDELGQKDVVSWNAMIAGYSKQGMGLEALRLYTVMQEGGVTVPDVVTFMCLLQACASVGRKALDMGRQLHAQIRDQGYQDDMFVANSLVDMYAKCDSLEEAQRVFDGLVRKDVVTWNVMIAGYSQQGMAEEALHLYRAMQDVGTAVPNAVTFLCLLKACASMGSPALEEGRQLHIQIAEQGLQADVSMANSLVNMYSKCGSLEDGQRVFDGLGQKDVVTWTALITGYSQQGMGWHAHRLYSSMQEEGLALPNSVTFVCILQAYAGIGPAALEVGKQLHGCIIDRGYQADVFVANNLVHMYAKCGSLKDAQKVFEGLVHKDVVTWTALISGYSQHGMGHEALRLYSVMQDEGIAIPNSVTFVCLLQACATVGPPALEMGKQLHAQIREAGHEADLFVANSLVNMYAKCGSLADSQKEFAGLGRKDVVTWNAMIAGCSNEGMLHEAFHLYNTMQEGGTIEPNCVTFVCLLQACASVGNPGLEIGKQLHAQIREREHGADVFVASSLVKMYAKCGSLRDAHKVFDGLSQKDVVTWNAVIGGYSQQGMGQEALHLYSAMQEDGMAVPDAVTFVCLLQACASVGTTALVTGRQLHEQITELGHQDDVVVSNSLVNMYAKCDSLEDAQIVFDGLRQKDVVTWNSMIAGYSQQRMGQEALELYSVMEAEGIALPDPVTFVCLLQACASVGTPALHKGKQLHAQIRKLGHESDAFVANSLVNMYAKCGSLDDAQEVFNGLDQKSVVTWTSLIAGYSHQGMSQEALRHYSAMQEEGIAVPDSVTFVCLLQACANVAALQLGRQLHAQVEQQGLQADRSVANGLIYMYGKCGSMIDARRVFDALPEKDVVTWNALIAGYACQGASGMVFKLVQRMRSDGKQPIGITFLSVLTVCSHAGLVDRGREYFESMTTHYGVNPTVEHYTCMLDLLGRAGQLDEALALATTMPVLATSAVWHTLLGACQKWGNVEVGYHAFNEAVKLDEKDAAAYVLMSNIYTGAKMWESAQRMQAARVETRAWKQPGESWWTDMDGKVHSFLSGMLSSPKSCKAKTL